ncbi:MAG: cell division protein ZipA [Pseudomonadales bacterium]|nr:cell division protein ZipA [Pseudomonadales bacterium]
MDIKDFILVGGGILIVLVIAHGFWIAYRAKREPYRLDIVPDLIPDHVDEMQRLRGELPNGGARVVRRIDKDLIPEQDSLDLELDSEPGSEADLQNTREPTPTLMDVAAEHVRSAVSLDRGRKPRIFQAPPRRQPESQEADQTRIAAEPEPAEIQDDLPLSASDKNHGRAKTEQEPLLTGTETNSDSEEVAAARVADVQLVTEKRGGRFAQVRTVRKPKPESGPDSGPESEVRAKSELPEGADGASREDGGPELDRAVEELLIVNVTASKGHTFAGDDIVRALRGQGLRYGEMNIFHRRDPMTKAKQFSVASLVEPGTFDLSDLDTLVSPGMSFFMQLPGPEDASDAFDDMVSTAQHVAFQLGGELRDEQMSVMTGQTREHMRQRIADFARRRLSIRA